MEIVETLLRIAEQSGVKYVDVAAGDAGGLKLRMRYSAAESESPDEKGTVGNEFFFPATVLPDRRYLIASITKPIVGMAVVQLAAEGYLALNDAVRDHLPGFHRGSLRQITIRHLLTHTSGLPDMLPQNRELRAAHAGTQDFVRATADVAPDFAAGADCQYSSMGFAVLAAIIESITRSSCADHLWCRVFQPLGMKSSWLGLPSESIDELLPTTLPCELPIWQDSGSDWCWNSRYWRSLGAAWGGMISTAEDLGRLATCLLNSGESQVPGLASNTIWSNAAIQASFSNQTQYIAGLSETHRIQRGWGFGWRRNWLDHAATFSDFLPAGAIGHWGATGTMMWIEPTSARWCVILTTQPYEQSQVVIQRMSNVIAVAGVQSCETTHSE